MNEWTPTGADGGAITAFAFHPGSEGVLLAGAGWSIYRSTDTGQSWTEVRSGVPGDVTSIVIDPSNPNRVLAANVNALYRSDDGGLNFGGAAGPPGAADKLIVAPDGSAVYANTHTEEVYRTTNFGATWEDASAGLPSGNVTDLVVDPGNASTLYALIEQHGLYRSTNGGAAWSSVDLDQFSDAALTKLAIDPAGSANLLLATIDDGLLESSDGGGTWALADARRYAWVGFHPSAGGAAAAVPWRGPVIRRVDDDAAWEEGQTLSAVYVNDVAFDPHDTADPANGTLLVATTDEPMLSTNGGMTFEVRSQGLGGSEVTHLAAANDGTIYAAYSVGPVGIHRRMPSGWAAADNTELTSRLLGAFNPLAIAVDPSNASVILMASGTSLVRSDDAGESWSAPNPDPALAFKLPRALVFDSTNPQVAYVGLEDGGVFRSNNAGITWLPSSNGLPVANGGPTGVGALAVDPSNPATVYAALYGPQAQPALFKSTNGGADWAAANNGFDLLSVGSLAVDPTNGNIVYAGGPWPSQGLSKSGDGGESWQRVGAPIDEGLVMGFAIDPVVPTTLYMTANRATGGAARSIDGGATWENLPQGQLGGSALLGTLTLDPLKPGNVIAAAPHHGLVEFTVSPDLEVAVVTAPAALPLGGTESVTLRVTNLGPLAASAVTLTISPPNDLTASVPTADQGSCAQMAGSSNVRSARCG